MELNLERRRDFDLGFKDTDPEGIEALFKGPHTGDLKKVSKYFSHQPVPGTQAAQAYFHFLGMLCMNYEKYRTRQTRVKWSATGEKAPAYKGRTYLFRKTRCTAFDFPETIHVWVSENNPKMLKVEMLREDFCVLFGPGVTEYKPTRSKDSAKIYPQSPGYSQAISCKLFGFTMDGVKAIESWKLNLSDDELIQYLRSHPARIGEPYLVSRLLMAYKRETSSGDYLREFLDPQIPEAARYQYYTRKNELQYSPTAQLRLRNMLHLLGAPSKYADPKRAMRPSSLEWSFEVDGDTYHLIELESFLTGFHVYREHELILRVGFKPRSRPDLGFTGVIRRNGEPSEPEKGVNKWVTSVVEKQCLCTRINLK